MTPLLQLTKHFSFEASHILPRHQGKCSRLHGHSWQLWVTVEGPVSEDSGFVCDYGVLSAIVKSEVIERLDHNHLGQGIPHLDDGGKSRLYTCPFGKEFYPSSENLAIAIARMLLPLIQEIPHVRLASIKIGETCTSECLYTLPPKE